jgi:hypothetical protein
VGRHAGMQFSPAGAADFGEQHRNPRRGSEMRPDMLACCLVDRSTDESYGGDDRDEPKNNREDRN